MENLLPFLALVLLGVSFLAGFWTRGSMVHGKYKVHEQIRMIKMKIKEINQLIAEKNIETAKLKIKKFSLTALNCSEKSFALFTGKGMQALVDVSHVIGEYKANMYQARGGSSVSNANFGFMDPPPEIKPVEFYQQRINTILLTFFKLEE